MDTISPEKRSAQMARIRSKNTKPELAVRSLLHRMGYRFRIHRRDLPGSPDIVLPRHKKIVLVHGCFWHRHTCQLASRPKSNSEYWTEKLLKNRARDQRNLEALESAGWRVLVLWECEVRKFEGLEKRLLDFLEERVD